MSARGAGVSGRLERRAAVADALSAVARVAEELESAVERASGAQPVDADGTLRTAARALLPVAARTPGFDVTIASGADAGWVVRVRHGSGGPAAELERRTPAPSVRTGDLPGAGVASELAALLRSGGAARR